MNSPMNPQNFLVAMLDVYIQWINMWTEPDHDVYTMNDFRNSRGVISIVVTGASSAFQRVLVEAEVYDGETQADLTAWFQIMDDGTNPMIAMVQGFDTSLQFIYNEGWVNTPDPRGS